MNSEYTQNQYANEIYQLRYQGFVDDAINKCQEAIDNYPENNFFYKILGDLFVQKELYIEASKSYIKQLVLINETPEYFKHFARFYRLFEKKSSEEDILIFQDLIICEVKKGKISNEIINKLKTIFFHEEFADKNLLSWLQKTNNDSNLVEVKNYVDDIENDNIIRSMLTWRIKDIDNTKCNQTDLYFISIGEKFLLYDETLALLKKVHSKNPKKNPTLIRTMFRICRKIQNYSVVEELFEINSQYIYNSDFNIQYELVYYFEFKEDNELLDLTLKGMRNSANNSIPIARTLYNFYLKFNKFEEASEVSNHIRALADKKKSSDGRIDEQIESERGVWDKLQELVSEQEHNRQMIALRDLLKGFSHELGQPVTNIRYSIQLYELKSKAGKIESESVDHLLKTILNQTERIGKLLGRFRPIVSSKSENVEFNIFDRINEVFENLSARLKAEGIEYHLNGDDNLYLLGDPVQFDQVFYNLILNSMQAISDENIVNGEINVLIAKNKEAILIEFKDNGPGIPKENTKKIFEPFYTTKDPSVHHDGGEGLGLFIVWNVIKMFSGHIMLDNSYHKGAKFIISLLDKEDEKYEQSINYRR